MFFEHRLDARIMEPPEPFNKATSILAQMKPGEYLKMLHRRVPYPLFDFCRNFQLRYSVTENTSADYEIIIYFKDEEDSLKQADIL